MTTSTDNPADASAANPGTYRTPPAEEERVLGAGDKLIGPERWVLFGYILAGALAFWLFDKLITRVWDQFAEPQETPITIAAAVLGVITALVLWRYQTVRSFADESAAELSKVTWPTKKETWSNTVVVIITSAIAAGILFAFDQFWGTVTDLIY